MYTARDRKWKPSRLRLSAMRSTACPPTTCRRSFAKRDGNGAEISSTRKCLWPSSCISSSGTKAWSVCAFPMSSVSGNAARRAASPASKCPCSVRPTAWDTPRCICCDMCCGEARVRFTFTNWQASWMATPAMAPSGASLERPALARVPHRLQAVMFRLAAEWFGCEVGEVAEREMANLPAGDSCVVRSVCALAGQRHFLSAEGRAVAAFEPARFVAR